MKKNKILAIGLGIIAFTTMPFYFEANAAEINEATSVTNEIETDVNNETFKESNTEEITLIEKIDLIKEAFTEEISNKEDFAATNDNLQSQETTTLENSETSKPAFGFTENKINSVILISIMFLILALVLVYTMFVVKRINLNANDE